MSIEHLLVPLEVASPLSCDAMVMSGGLVRWDSNLTRGGDITSTHKLSISPNKIETASIQKKNRQNFVLCKNYSCFKDVGLAWENKQYSM